MLHCIQGESGVAELIRREPEGLAECRTRMQTLLRETSILFGDLPLNKFVLAGFSQGKLILLSSLQCALWSKAMNEKCLASLSRVSTALW